MANRHKDNGAAVPSGRVTRLLRFGGIATGIAGHAALGGLRSLAQGRAPDLSQIVLTPSNTVRLANGLTDLRGAALKMGQMLSMDAGVLLPEELSLLLARLRDNARHMPPKQLQTVLNREWGAGWHQRFADFDVRPFAAASIGQVHRARTRDGRDLAIKVQYPGIRESIDSDVDNMATLLRLPGLTPKGMDLAPLMAEAKRQLHSEADYQAEARNMVLFSDLLAGADEFRLPLLHKDLCTAQVLAMSYIDSDPLESLINAPQARRDRLAATLIDLVLREIFVFGAMQTDPNLANYRYEPNTGRIVLLDFGAVQPIAPSLTADFRNLARVVLTGSENETRDAMLRVGYFGPDTAPHHQALITALFQAAMVPLRQDTPFDFGNSDLLERLRDQGLAIGSERDLAHIPPAATLFLHRKIGGTYLMAAKLKARVALRPMIERYCL